MRSPLAATKSSPRLLQLEEARAKQWRPNAAKKKKKKNYKKYIHHQLCISQEEVNGISVLNFLCCPGWVDRYWLILNFDILISWLGTSLVAQWLRICLPMQGTWVRALVWEDPTWHRATKPLCHNYWACALEPTSHNYWAHAPRAHAPQQEKPPQWEAHASQQRVAPARCN